MLQRILALVVISSITLIPSMGLAQPPIPQADDNGDFHTTPTQWQVVDPDVNGLNCRAEPGTEHVVVTTFQRNTVLNSAQNRVQNDQKGKPWVQVSSRQGNCFVRANSDFILPIDSSGR